MEKQPNIVFVVVDAFRASNLGCYGYDKPTSPVIDGLAKEDALCKECANVHGGTEEFYDLNEDPLEKINVSLKMPSLV